MPTADATLLPPAYDNDPADRDDRSNRHLEEIGAHAVLGAMVEAKKRASIPAAIELDESALEFDHDDDVRVQRPRRPAVSDVFLKAR